MYLLLSLGLLNLFITIRQKDGVVRGDVFISYKSIGQDVRHAMDVLHVYVRAFILILLIFVVLIGVHFTAFSCIQVIFQVCLTAVL